MAFIGISRSEFARREGCTQPLVSMAVKAGRLPVLADGTLDPALVGTPWRASNREQRDAQASSGGPKRGRPRKVVEPVETPVHGAAPVAAQPGQAPSVNPETRQPYAEALLRKEQSLAALRELEYQQKAAKLIELEVARRVVFEEFRTLRNALLAWPVKVAPVLAAKLNIDAEQLTLLLADLMHEQLAELGEPEPDFARTG